jgi:hypothetical protein
MAAGVSGHAYTTAEIADAARAKCLGRRSGFQGRPVTAPKVLFASDTAKRFEAVAGTAERDAADASVMTGAWVAGEALHAALFLEGDGVIGYAHARRWVVRLRDVAACRRSEPP